MSKVEIDDVTYALTGKVKLAERSITVNIPPAMSTTSGRRARKISVSSAGEKLLQKEQENRDKALENAEDLYRQGVEKLQAEREERERKAWEGMNKIVDAVESLKENSREARNSGRDDDEVDDVDESTDESTDAVVENSGESNETSDSTYSQPQADAYQAPQVTQQYGGWNNN